MSDGGPMQVTDVTARFADLGSDGEIARLGIMGGTFDPIHLGHLLCAEQARERFALDGVLFVPAGNPVRKAGKHLLDPERRFKMVQMAISSNESFDVSRIEIDREGLTYTVDTLTAMRGLFPNNVRFYFITGADAIWDILTWRRARELAELATFVGATRPGFDLEGAMRAHADSDVGFDVRYLEIPLMAISSSDIRERVKDGRSIRYLTPDAVCDYISENNLYTEDEG